MATQTKPKPSGDAATETPARVLPLEITKVGNLTDDPALDFAKETNRPFARFRLAVERPKVPGDWAGERETTFYSVTCFDSVATNVCESLEKGAPRHRRRPARDRRVDRQGRKQARGPSHPGECRWPGPAVGDRPGYPGSQGSYRNGLDDLCGPRRAVLRMPADGGLPVGETAGNPARSR